jgi:response regulator RpfG family c-di-GMP phosphodiesterase
MSTSEIKKILEAESEADMLRSETAAKINQLLSSAETEGRRVYRSIISEAEAFVKEKEKETAEKLAKASKESAALAEQKAAKIKEAAAAHIEQAARLICERIIKS